MENKREEYKKLKNEQIDLENKVKDEYENLQEIDVDSEELKKEYIELEKELNRLNGDMTIDDKLEDCDLKKEFEILEKKTKYGNSDLEKSPQGYDPSYDKNMDSKNHHYSEKNMNIEKEKNKSSTKTLKKNDSFIPKPDIEKVFKIFG